MNGVKKVFNVFGILVAWILSIVLVILLLVTPIVFSTLSMLSVDVITDIFTQSLTPSAQMPEKNGVQMVQLSNVSEETPSDTITVGGIDISQFGDLEEILGAEISQESVEKILSSDAAKELVDAYVSDVTNAFTGKDGEVQFNSEKIKTIVNENIDEIVEVLKDTVPELADMDAAQLKADIIKAVEENADQIVEALPKPEDIKNEIANNAPELEIAMQILAMKDTIKLAIIGVIVVLSLLIFLCRIPGLRGFRWLATDLIIAGSFNGLITVGLFVSQTALGEVAVQAGAQVAAIVGALLSTFANGMLIRTAVMLVAGVALLVVYILIENHRAKKLAAAEEGAEMTIAQTVVAEVAPENGTVAE